MAREAHTFDAEFQDKIVYIETRGNNTLYLTMDSESMSPNLTLKEAKILLTKLTEAINQMEQSNDN